MVYSKISDKQCNQAGYAGKQNATIDGAGPDERGTMAGGQGRGLDRRPCPHSSRQLPQRGHVTVARPSRVSTRRRAWAFPTLSLSATGAVCLPLARVCLPLSLSLCILRRLQCRPLAPKAFLALACFPLPTLVTLRSLLGHWHYLIPWIFLRS